MKIAKQKGDKLTFEKVENMIKETVLSLDEESECSENEDFEPIASNLPSSSDISEKSSDDSSDIRQKKNCDYDAKKKRQSSTLALRNRSIVVMVQKTW